MSSVTRLAGVAAAIAVLCGSASAEKPENPDLARGIEFLRNMEDQKAVAALGKALVRPGNSQKVRAQIFVYIGIAQIMDTLRQISQHEGIPASQRNVPIFHSEFLSSIKRHSRLHEASMAALFTLRSAGLKGLMQQAGLGLTMFKKGKLKILPAKLFGNRQVKGFFKQAKRKR